MPYTGEPIAVVPVEAPSDKELAGIGKLAERQRKLEQKAAEQTAELQQTLRQLAQVSEVDLPAAMRNANCAEFRLSDGTRIKIIDKYVGNKVTERTALDTIAELGGSSLIKTVITVELDRGDIDKAREVFQDLRQHRFANQFTELTMEESVHQSTIAAFVRELIEQGRDVPIEKLRVRHQVSTQVGDRAPKTVKVTGFKLEEGE